MRRLIVSLLSFAFAASLGATAQAPDVLKIGAGTYSIHTNPLTPYLLAHPGRLPEAEVISTGLWRGYIGKWSIRENQLYLDEVSIPTRKYTDSDAPESEQFQSGMKPLFGDDGPQVATWFTGHLIVPTGEMVQYVHMGYASTYEAYKVITIVKGAVQQQHELDAAGFDKFRRSQYAAYKKTPEYAAARAEIEKDDDGSLSAEQKEDFLFQFASGEYLSRIFDR